jgi:hypothetical protein
MIDFTRTDKIRFLVILSDDEYKLEVVNIKIPSVIADIFSFNSWTYVRKIFKCVTNSHGYADNGSDIMFPDEAAEFGEFQNGIKIYNPIQELEFEEESFQILANRYFAAVITLAKNNNDRILNNDWGKVFLRSVSSLNLLVE